MEIFVLAIDGSAFCNQNELGPPATCCRDAWSLQKEKITDGCTAVPDILGLGYLSPADMNYIFVTYGKKF